MSDRKTVSEWEKEKNVIVTGLEVGDLGRVLTESEFDDLQNTNGYAGVHHDDRIAFLKQNGYDVTRKNMLEPTLSARQEEDQ